MNSDSQRDKWNARYRNSGSTARAAQVLLDNQHLLPATGKALELACGLGGNALLLARHGLETSAWDLSDVAISRLDATARAQNLQITASAVDIERDPPAPKSFDVICVSGFLDRDCCPAIVAALKPGGLLFYQTFTQFKISQGGPGNPAFLLARGELLSLFSALTPVVYREEMDCGDLDLGLRNQACLIARKDL